MRKVGSVESVVINTEDQFLDLLPADYSNNPDARFVIRIETPPDYPPQGAEELHRTAGQITREIYRRLGKPVKQRLRTSKLVKNAGHLRVGKKRLKSGESYQITDKLYPDGDLSKDQERRKHVISDRHRVVKRFRSIDTGNQD